MSLKFTVFLPGGLEKNGKNYGLKYCANTIGEKSVILLLA